MKLKKDGFSGAYHHVCAFELNDKLRELTKDCPDAAKASHAVFYGYVDPKQGLMLELLGVGKQAPKYFYFKDPYMGERVTVSAKDIANIEFMYFPKLQKSEREKYGPRIEQLKEFDVPEEIEKLRGEEFGFLDEFRDLRRPDVVRVTFLKESLNPEEVPVLFTGTGDHCLIGIIQKKPKQDFGPGKGDTIEFHARKTDEDKIELYFELTEQHELTQEDLDNGSFLKFCIGQFLQNTEDQEAFGFLLAVMRSSSVVVPCDIHLSDEAAAIAEKMEKAGKSLDELEGEEEEKFRLGMQFLPRILENERGKFFPAFTNNDELNGQMDDVAMVNMSVVHALDMASTDETQFTGIVVNAYTDNFIVTKELFETIRKMNPLFSEDDEKENNAGMQGFSNHEDLALAVVVDKMAAFNYALYLNKVNPIQGIRIINDTGDPITGLSLRITSDFDFFAPYEISLPSIPSGKPISLSDPKLKVDGNKLAVMTDEVLVQITVELCKNGETMCGVRGHMQVLAYDQWMGGIGYRYLLPAFVIPSHPAIPVLMHDAAEILGKWGKKSSLEGYQSHDPNRVRELAAAAYAAIQKKNIVYAEPPISFFEAVGQQIRTPETVMEQRLGTCMDMTLLYAALLEGMGLQPMLVLIHGHIFAGVWLKERTSEELKASNVIIEDAEQLSMRIDNGTDELTFIECTAMCTGKQVSFEEAETIAKQGNLDPASFDMAIDVFLSRANGIKPVPPRIRDGSTFQIEVTDKGVAELTEAPTDHGITIAEVTEVKGKKITNKRELWESKLLDLSTHNMLLNLPRNASVQPIMSSHIDELEDALSDGHEFNLLPVAEWILGLSYTTIDKSGKKSKEIQWLPQAIAEQGIFELTHWPTSADFDFNEKFRQEYRNHRLYTYCSPKQLDHELTTIYRAARASQQENGVSSLYLAIGLLRWYAEPESKDPCYAPLILLPIEIVRKSANQGYALHAREDEPHFNTTLLEMLKQNFNLNIGGLEPLPADEHGIDIKKVFAVVRSSLFTVKGWDVIETCVIGNFSFAQFAMWNDIHNAGDMLENSNAVRSLMKGHVDWEVTNIDAELDEEKVFLPITVDSTQLKAIKMAAHGSTFVLHGPPGTGKSQTITGMIANLMAQGKTVLFVAEKMAALTVVQKRLSSLGIGDFCLELHSDKANKKQLFAQLERAINATNDTGKNEYDEYQRRTNESREKLDGYAQHLHKVRKCGYSLHELIDLYETVEHVDYYIPFDRYEVSSLTKEVIANHVPLIDRLLAAGSAFGSLDMKRFSSINLSTYSANVRSVAGRGAQSYAETMRVLTDTANEICSKLGQKTPETIQEYDDLADLSTVFSQNSGTQPMVLMLLSTGIGDAKKYLQKAVALEQQRAVLESIWEPAFLDMNMSTLLQKHESAGKKFLGKSSAMSTVTAEVQSYSKNRVSYEQIPALLKVIETYQKEKMSLSSAYAALSSETKEIIFSYGTIDVLEEAYSAALDCKNQAKAFPGGLDAIVALTKNSEMAKLFSNYLKAFAAFKSAREEFNNAINRSTDPSTTTLTEECIFCEFIQENVAYLKDYALYNQVRSECIRAGLMPVVKEYENNHKKEDIVLAYRKGLYYALINHVIDTDELLASFSGATFNDSIQQFKLMDDKLLEQTKKEIYHRLIGRVPSAWESPEIGAELSLLRKAIGSNARGMSIRTLFERIPNVLQRLCPCMLMSPNSVAQYLERNSELFDVVIFDEASQLPTCKAIGALARAKNAVIVGDPKQMPPTTFFAGSGPIVEDLALDDLDSILDDALALGIPSQHLQWHYRSTHESLIAFSNHQFYDNKMYTFPSSNDRERHVTAVHVEGVYNKSTNPKEAEAVVAEVVRRFHDPVLSKQSIGIVTFNVKQQDLIYNLLAKQFQVNPELDSWANSGEDSLFIKNLENVQGDERDVILFSIGYGPDEKGRISMNFGPINKPGGGKRLNVAFSRARVSMMIFSSIYSSDLKVADSSPEGLIAFRDFLKFAEGQELSNDAAKEKNRAAEKAGIMQSICKELAAKGYQSETLVGHSDFHVDIAVIDPFEPTKYLMGILLDGEGYQQTKNTRDREVAQISVLKNLGWNLHRVWTIDWWDNKKKELTKLFTALDDLRELSRVVFEKKQQEAQEISAAVEKQAEEDEKLREELARQTAEVEAEEQEALSEYPFESIKPVIETASIPSETRQGTTEQKTPDNSAQPKKKPSLDKPQEMTAGNLLYQMQDEGISVVDKRKNGGALWIIGGKSLKPYIDQLLDLGVHFIFKAGGGKATDGKDGWWAKTDVVIEAPAEESPMTNPKVEVNNEAEIAVEPARKDEISVVHDSSNTDVKAENEEPVASSSESEKSTDDVHVESQDASSNEPYVYIAAEVPFTQLSSAAEYAEPKYKTEIARRAELIVDTEAPILRESLIKKLMASFGITRTNLSLEATEKALKVANIKNAKLKGVIFCWKKDQDPNSYTGIRISNERSGDEIAPQEMRNVFCYALKKNGSMEKDALIKAASIIFGYKRLGKNLETALLAGLQFAKSNGAVVLISGKYNLPEKEALDIVPMPVKKEHIDISADENSVTTEITSEAAKMLTLTDYDESILFYCEGENYRAVAAKIQDGFSVLKGSKINPIPTKSCPASTLQIREKNADKIGPDFVLQSDISFASPSGAAAFVAGASRNGYTEWHKKDGTMLKDTN